MVPNGSNVKSIWSINMPEIPKISPVRAKTVPEVSRNRIRPLLTPVSPDESPSSFMQIFLRIKLYTDLINDGNLW